MKSIQFCHCQLIPKYDKQKKWYSHRYWLRLLCNATRTTAWLKFDWFVYLVPQIKYLYSRSVYSLHSSLYIFTHTLKQLISISDHKLKIKFIHLSLNYSSVDSRLTGSSSTNLRLNPKRKWEEYIFLRSNNKPVHFTTSTQYKPVFFCLAHSPETTACTL